MRFVFFILSLLPSLVFAQAECPSSFQTFFTKFEVDRAFQQQNIRYPLKYSFVDMDASPEPQVVKKPRSKAAVAADKQAVYPLLAHRKKAGLVKKVVAQSKTRATIELNVPDTGYWLIYYFKVVKGCWKLIEFEDKST